MFHSIPVHFLPHYCSIQNLQRKLFILLHRCRTGYNLCHHFEFTHHTHLQSQRTNEAVQALLSVCSFVALSLIAKRLLSALTSWTSHVFVLCIRIIFKPPAPLNTVDASSRLLSPYLLDLPPSPLLPVRPPPCLIISALSSESYSYILHPDFAPDLTLALSFATDPRTRVRVTS